MRFRTNSPWPVHGVVIPGGTVFDTNDPGCPVKGLTIPIDATPLDAEAYEVQLKSYAEHRHLLSGGWEEK